MPDLPIYNKCNNNCKMCSNPDSFWEMKRGFSLPYLLRRIDKFYKGEKVFLGNYRDTFYITGGEPTLSPHLVTVIKRIGYLFPNSRIVCLTNGRMFSYVDYVKGLLQLSAVSELAISIHGHKEEIHDKITGVKGSFSQTFTGLKNAFQFKKPAQLIEIRVVIHRLNYKFLNAITKFILEEFPLVDRLVFIFFEIEGQAYKHLATLRLTYAQLFPYISKIYNLIHYFSDVRFYHFPLCTMTANFFPYISRTLPDSEVAFLDKCNECNVKEFCLGVHKGYLKYIGSLEFQPIRDKFNIKKGANWHRPILKIGL